MSKENNGGTAFPVLELNGQGQLELTDSGMTLRDHFAGLAMQGQISFDQNQRVEHVATWAYAMADAMLEARKL